MPHKNLISEVLSAHADQILHNQNYEESYTTLFPDDQNLPPLLNLADQVKETLQHVCPPSSFKEQLQRDLMAAAHLKQEERKRAAQFRAKMRPLLIFALINVLMSLIIFIRRRRQKNGLLN